MPTQYTKRFILVVRSSVVAAANLAAKSNDCDPVGGENTFTVPLSATGSAPATHYWCSWTMTVAQALAIRTRLRERGATVAETTPVPFGQTVSNPRFAVFDVADGWTPELVLTACGLQRITVVEAPVIQPFVMATESVDNLQKHAWKLFYLRLAAALVFAGIAATTGYCVGHESLHWLGP